MKLIKEKNVAYRKETLNTYRKITTLRIKATGECEADRIGRKRY